MDFRQSVETVVMKKYMMLDGRASRSEFWWYVLAYFIAAIVAEVIDSVLGLPGIVGLVVGLALLIPSITVAARRLHDIGKSGWWQLLAFVPIIGILVLIYFYVQKSAPGSNQYGPPPAA